MLLTVILLLLTATAAGNDADVMSEFRTSLTSPPSNWKAENYCSWDGITCDDRMRVTTVDLSSRSLTGKLPTALNQLTQLETLEVQNNSLSGALPSLANLTFLRIVNLDSNNFTSIPQDFFLGLISLQNLSISDNLALTPWNLPRDLAESTNLEQLTASRANINGVIPDIFDSLGSLVDFRLSDNNVTGGLPKSFGGSQIQHLWLNNQNLSGNIDVLSNMTELYQVWLQANAFTGALPDFSQCINLFDLQLRDNQLTGIVPNSLIKLLDLVNITLGKNKLQGEFPMFGDNVSVDVSLNSFCLPSPGPCDPQVMALLEVAGAIGYPMSLAKSWTGNDACNGWNFVACDSSKNVTAVSFARQKFSGSISPAFATLTSLRNISLNDNNLMGMIPDVLTSLPNLKLIDVAHNNLSGIAPHFRDGVTFSHEGNPLLDQIIPGEPNGPRGTGPSSKGLHGSFLPGIIVGIVVCVVLQNNAFGFV